MVQIANKETRNMETIEERGPIIVRLLQAMNKSGVDNDTERRRLIKEITGVSKQNLLHWFNGTTTTPGVDHLVKLSEYFNIDLNWLITGQFKQPSTESPEYDSDISDDNNQNIGVVNSHDVTLLGNV